MRLYFLFTKVSPTEQRKHVFSAVLAQTVQRDLPGGEENCRAGETGGNSEEEEDLAEELDEANKRHFQLAGRREERMYGLY